MLGKLTTKIKQDGILFPLHWLVKKAFYAERDTVLLTRPLDPFTNRARQSNIFTVRQLSKADLPAAETYFHSQAGAYSEILENGIVAFGAFLIEGGDLIGVNFYTPEDYYDPHLYRYKFNVPEGHVYQFAAEVTPDYQRSSAITAILNEAVRYWRERGYHSFLSAVDVKNTVSLSVHFNSGYEETKKGVMGRTYFGVFKSTSGYDYRDNRFDHLRQRYLKRTARREKVSSDKPVRESAAAE